MSKLTQVLLDPKLAPTAMRVALIVGSILFTINHGAALAKGEMTNGHSRLRRFICGAVSFRTAE